MNAMLFVIKVVAIPPNIWKNILLKVQMIDKVLCSSLPLPIPKKNPKSYSSCAQDKEDTNIKNPVVGRPILWIVNKVNSPARTEHVAIDN